VTLLNFRDFSACKFFIFSTGFYGKSKKSQPLSVTDVPTPDASSDEPDQEGVEQRIQVLDTASGEPVLSVAATPVVLNGQNFSLSSDGRRLALLRGAT
jgi:hypothetical protein